MYTEDDSKRLKELGYTIGRSAVRDDGKELMLISDVFMFAHDAVDLARGLATFDEILARNDGKVFPAAPKS